MSRSTISTFDLYPPYLEKQRWPNGPVCPDCGEAKRIYVKRGGFRCNACLREFTVRTGTIFAETAEQVALCNIIGNYILDSRNVFG